MLTADFSEVIAEIDMMIQRAHETAPFLDAVGKLEVERVKERILSTKIDPTGDPWAPWSQRRLEERAEKGNEGLGLLLDEGNLYHSIHAQLSGEGVEIGTELDYAADLQLGTPIMPARPFLGWDIDTFPEYEALFIRYWETGTI